MSNLHFNVLDWILVALLVFCVLRGMMRGAVSQVFGIAGILGALFMAAHFHEGLAVSIREAFPTFGHYDMASFLILFLLTWFCIELLCGFLRRSSLGPLDKLLGAAIGLVKGGALAMVLVMVLTLFLPAANPLLSKSQLEPHVLSLTKAVKDIAPKDWEGLLKEKGEQIKQMKKRIPSGVKTPI